MNRQEKTQVLATVRNAVLAYELKHRTGACVHSPSDWQALLLEANSALLLLRALWGDIDQEPEKTP